MDASPPNDLPSSAWVTDPAFGRRVRVPDRMFAKVARDHEDVVGLSRGAVLDAVMNADLHRGGNVPYRHLYYRRGVGPSRWLCVVVQYDRSGFGEAFTAFGVRRLPKELER